MSSVSRISPAEELAAFLARSPSPQEIGAFRLSEPALKRVRELMDKNKDGVLTPEESRELDRLVLLDDIIALIQSHVSMPAADPEGHDHREPQDAQDAGDSHAGASGS